MFTLVTQATLDRNAGVASSPIAQLVLRGMLGRQVLVPLGVLRGLLRLPRLDGLHVAEQALEAPRKPALEGRLGELVRREPARRLPHRELLLRRQRQRLVDRVRKRGRIRRMEPCVSAQATRKGVNAAAGRFTRQSPSACLGHPGWSSWNCVKYGSSHKRAPGPPPEDKLLTSPLALVRHHNVHQRARRRVHDGNQPRSLHVSFTRPTRLP